MNQIRLHPKNEFQKDWFFQCCHKVNENILFLGKHLSFR